MASKQEIFEAVWGGLGVPLIHNYELGRGEYPSTILGAMTDRIVRQQITPLRQGSHRTERADHQPHRRTRQRG